MPLPPLGYTHVRVCHTLETPNGPVTVCFLEPAPWPGLLAAGQDPSAFSLTIAGKELPGVGNDLLAVAAIRQAAGTLSDASAGAEIAKLADAALATLNAGLPAGFGTLDATLVSDAGQASRS
jgi:hypothetical protein